MNLGVKLGLGALVTAGAAIGITACGSEPAPDDVLGWAEAETNSDARMQAAFDLASRSDRPATEAVTLIRAAGEHTNSDDLMVMTLRAALMSSRPADDAARIIDAAEASTNSDFRMLDLATIGFEADASTDEVVAAFERAYDTTNSDDAAIQVAQRLLDVPYPDAMQPSDLPGAENYPAGPTSTGDD